jgi:hypothetical protein
LDFHFKKRQLLEQAILRIQSQTPIVKAEDLIKLGVKPGIKMGKLLKEAERISVNQGEEIREKIILELKKTNLWNE